MTASRDQFDRDCKRRFGMANPERMDIPHWEWMVRTRADPYQVRRELGLGPHYGSGDPDWCFERFGMTETPMPDGRIICIGGEHEDYYDPDFCIYNDVVVLRPNIGGKVDEVSGTVEIYGYAEDTFPPTDFHSATLVGERIILIGGLGYEGSRRIGNTPVFVLDTTTYRIEPMATHGDPPGWIYKHLAAYDPVLRAITVRWGFVGMGHSNREIPSGANHRLCLDSGEWSQMGG